MGGSSGSDAAAGGAGQGTPGFNWGSFANAVGSGIQGIGPAYQQGQAGNIGAGFGSSSGFYSPPSPTVPGQYTQSTPNTVPVQDPLSAILRLFTGYGGSIS